MFSSLFISLDPAPLLLLEGLVSVAKVVGVVAAVELVPVQDGLEAGTRAVGAGVEEGLEGGNLKLNKFLRLSELFLVGQECRTANILLPFL